MKATTPKFLAVTSFVAALTLLAGCSSGDSAEPAESPDAAPVADWQEGAPAEWAEILEKGQAEGEVVLDSSPELQQSDFAARFEADTGIKIVSAAAESSARYTAMEQEAQANQLSIDVSLGGGTELRMIDQGLLQDIKAQMILPNVTDPDNWVGGDGPTWMDDEGKYMLRSSNYVFGWAIVNSDTFDAEEFDSWDDLLDPKYKGKIATYDPLSGPGQAVSAFFYDALGEEFVEDLYVGQELVPTTDRRQLIEWVARGTYDIALGGTQAELERFAREGLPVTGVMPREGIGQYTGGSGVLKQPLNANGSLTPHPNAAQVFINWFASTAGQQAYDDAMLEVTTRNDVDLSKIPDYVKPEEDREYIDTYEEYWYTVVRNEVAAELRTMLE